MPRARPARTDQDCPWYQTKVVSQRQLRPPPGSPGTGGLTGIPAEGWRQVSRSGTGATVESGAVTLRVIQDPTGHGT
jgi:hypothetical protein